MDTWRPLPFLTTVAWIRNCSRIPTRSVIDWTCEEWSKGCEIRGSSLVGPEADQFGIVIRDSKLEQSQPSRVILYIIITGHSVFPSELLFEFFACFLRTEKNTIWKSKTNRIPIYNCPVGLNDWTKKKKSNLLLIEEVDPDTLFFANSCLLMCENYSVTE